MNEKAGGAADDQAARFVLRLSSLELWLCVIITLIAVAFLWEAAKLPPALAKTDIGAGVFPKIVGVAALICSVLLTVKALMTRSRAPVSSDPSVAIERPMAVALAAAATVALAALFPILGAYATSALAVGALMLISGSRQWWLLLSIPLLTAVLIYLCFGLLLHVRFP